MTTNLTKEPERREIPSGEDFAIEPDDREAPPARLDGAAAALGNVIQFAQCQLHRSRPLPQVSGFLFFAGVFRRIEAVSLGVHEPAAGTNPQARIAVEVADMAKLGRHEPVPAHAPRRDREAGEFIGAFRAIPDNFCRNIIMLRHTILVFRKSEKFPGHSFDVFTGWKP